MIAQGHDVASCSRREDGDYVACLVEFKWATARKAYESLRWMALTALVVAGWGLWYRASHGWSMDHVTLGIAVASAVFGLLRPASLRLVVNSGAALVAELAAASTPAPSERPAIRIEEIGLMAIIAAAFTTLLHITKNRVHAVTARMLAARAAIIEMLHPRLATSLVIRHAAYSAA